MSFAAIGRNWDNSNAYRPANLRRHKKQIFRLIFAIAPTVIPRRLDNLVVDHTFVLEPFILLE